jgi:hypothetical protein
VEPSPDQFLALLRRHASRQSGAGAGDLASAIRSQLQEVVSGEA